MRKSTLLVFSCFLSIILGCAADGTGNGLDGRNAKYTNASGNDGVVVHLFEWKWTDIEKECASLARNGISAVQVSPPQEHLVATGEDFHYPWWQRYQPVSYAIESRSGSREEFAAMVGECSRHGVDIYVDAVINHMAGFGEGVGSAGTSYDDKYSLAPYQPEHFNQAEGYDYCALGIPGPAYELPRPNEAPADCDASADNPEWNDRAACFVSQWDAETRRDLVRNCELLGLADLDTSQPYVRDRITAYLNDLVSLGVAGFRIDAAKHMHADHIEQILAGVQGRERLYIYQEVIDEGGEVIRAEEYLDAGNITEFRYGLRLGDAFHTGDLASLEDLGRFDFGKDARTDDGLLPSGRALVFTDNHDNQRGHGGSSHVLTHEEPELHALGNIFMLAWPYGRPRLMSSYAFSDGNQGPPADASGNTRDVRCGDGWVCEHRRAYVPVMTTFREKVGGSPVVDFWSSEKGDAIAFGRGPVDGPGRGFVVISGSRETLEARIPTSLASGRKYENRLQPGEEAAVRDGHIEVRVAPLSAAVFLAE